MAALCNALRKRRTPRTARVITQTRLSAFHIVQVRNIELRLACTAGLFVSPVDIISQLDTFKFEDGSVIHPDRVGDPHVPSWQWYT